MPPVTAIPARQVHLDFHTSPHIANVGHDFDAREFARVMKAAHVQSVNVFAKCHHGHLYYRTARPERHPALPPELDLVGEEVAALHQEGIRAPIYISIQCDEYAANLHPDWVARNPDSTQVKWAEPISVFKPGWQILDMSSPYQDYVAEQIAEILEKFKPVEGVWFDMCWDQPSASKWAIEGMWRANLDPESATDRAQYARQVAHGYMRRFRDMVKAASPDATIYFNGRLFPHLADDIQFQEQIELECLPSGGWGYMYFPMHVRYARTFGKPYLGMTARFHKSWADFGGIKPYASLEYETSQMMANGARCSIGDQMHPRGVLDPAAYDIIGRAYARVEAREPWLHDVQTVAEIGCFQVPSGESHWFEASSHSDQGLTRMLIQLRQQFDFVHTGSDLARYRVLILPDAVPVDTALAARLADYVSAGGRLLVTGTSGLTADGATAIIVGLGIQPQGTSPFTTTYFRLTDPDAAGMPATDHVMYERGVRVVPAADTEIIATVVEPYFERAWNHFSSHFQTPPDQASPFAAAVVNGSVAYVSYPIFKAFALHGNYPYRQLVQYLLNRLLPDPLLRAGGPTGLEATIVRQEARTIVHLLYYAPERRAPNLDLVEDIIPVANVALSVRLPSAPTRVYLAPEMQALSFTYNAGRVNLIVPEVSGHAMVVIE
jgi:hypothetical protein